MDSTYWKQITDLLNQNQEKDPFKLQKDQEMPVFGNTVDEFLLSSISSSPSSFTVNDISHSDLITATTVSTTSVQPPNLLSDPPPNNFISENLSSILAGQEQYTYKDGLYFSNKYLLNGANFSSAVLSPTNTVISGGIWKTRSAVPALPKLKIPAPQNTNNKSNRGNTKNRKNNNQNNCSINSNVANSSFFNLDSLSSPLESLTPLSSDMINTSLPTATNANIQTTLFSPAGTITMSSCSPNISGVCYISTTPSLESSVHSQFLMPPQSAMSPIPPNLSSPPQNNQGLNIVNASSRSQFNQTIGDMASAPVYSLHSPIFFPMNVVPTLSSQQQSSTSPKSSSSSRRGSLKSPTSIMSPLKRQFNQDQVHFDFEEWFHQFQRKYPHGTRPKLIQCPFPGCTKEFKKVYHLKSHVVCHSDDKPFLCPQCPSTFRRNHDLKRHLRTAHSSSKPYQCEKCKRSFARKDHYARHLVVEAKNHGLLN